MTNKAPIALITGAGQRIGRHLALKLAQSGWDIAGTYRTSKGAMNELSLEVKATGRRLISIQADLANEQAPADIMRTCLGECGAPALLINNASIFEKDHLDDIKPDQFDRHIAINLRSPIQLAKLFAAECKRGNIINITDQRVVRPGVDFYSYTISKIGLAGATTTMALSLAPSIRVNAIAPGPVLKSIHQTEAQFANESAATPLGIGADVNDIYRAVEFILKTPAMTGETIHLDGGQRLS